MQNFSQVTVTTENENMEDTRGSVVGRVTMLQAGRSVVRFPMRSLHLSIDLIRPAAIWPRVRLSL
jgi:hypothetical protein